MYVCHGLDIDRNILNVVIRSAGDKSAAVFPPRSDRNYLYLEFRVLLSAENVRKQLLQLLCVEKPGSFSRANVAGKELF